MSTPNLPTTTLIVVPEDGSTPHGIVTLPKEAVPDIHMIVVIPAGGETPYGLIPLPKTTDAATDLIGQLERKFNLPDPRYPKEEPELEPEPLKTPTPPPSPVVAPQPPPQHAEIKQNDRVCVVCGVTKPEDDFYVIRKNYRSRKCKGCTAASLDEKRAQKPRDDYKYTKRPTGPNRLEKEVLDRINHAMEMGVPLSKIASAVDIPAQTFYSWKRKGLIGVKAAPQDGTE